jgi:hypothetical protein
MSIQAVMSKMSHRHTKGSENSKKDGAELNGEGTTHVWTVGQEFQFYVPWLWQDSLGLTPDKLHPNRQVVRIARPTVFPELIEDLRHAWIQNCVASAVKDLVHDKDHYPTSTEGLLEQVRYKQTEAWRNFNIVQRHCNLPQITVPGYDGVVAVEMTIIIRRISVQKERAGSSHIEWLDLPSPGSCIERIRDQIHIHLTPECSLHTHIRPKTVPEVDLKSLKKLAALLWLAEDRLDKLYHPARDSLTSPLHRSLRRCSNLALDKSPLITGDLGDYATFFHRLNLQSTDLGKLATIWQAKDRHQLRELFRVHRSIGKHDYPAYNFFNLFKTSQKQTIEFRKTEATTEGQVVNSWIEVFVLLAHFSMTCPVETFRRVAENLGRPQGLYSTWQFLADIGCKGPVVDVLNRKSLQQWGVPRDSGARSSSSGPAAPSPNMNSRRRRSSVVSHRVRDAIRENAEKIGATIAEGYSYRG